MLEWVAGGSIERCRTLMAMKIIANADILTLIAQMGEGLAKLRGG
jgi:hypothetical protein